MAELKNRWRGYVNHANGQTFEAMIQDTLDIYRAHCLANIHKYPEPLKVIRNKGKGVFECVFTKRSQPDFIGVMRGGRCVVFEAKHTDADRIQQDAVKDHQATALDQYSALGAACYVLVSLRMRDFFFLPWTVWKGMKLQYGHKYATAMDMCEYRVTSAGGTIDFLDLLGEEE